MSYDVNVVTCFFGAVDDMEAASGVRPARAKVGEDMAAALWRDLSKAQTMAPLADWMRSIESGVAILYGVRLEAGWPHG